MSAIEPPPIPPVSCPQCGTQIGSGLKACPSCRWLVHGEKLRPMAGEAERFEAEGNLAEALGKWRLVLELLPPESRQAAVIRTKVDALSAKAAETGAVTIDPGRQRAAEERLKKKLSGRWKWLAPLAPVAILLLKFKGLALLILTKGKFLLLGLTNIQTLLTMLLSLGAYWTLWGWKFALGLILCIYVHEMGHVAALRRFGLRATAPMFIPGFGALVMLKQHPSNPREDARIGMGGPIWGVSAAVACLAIYALSKNSFWAALGMTAAWINLFNLIPVWQMDGSRAFHSMSRKQRWVAAIVMGGCFLATRELFALVAAGAAAFRAFPKASQNESSDPLALSQYAGTAIVITAVIRLVQSVLAGQS
jgi:Zn-dependent protease